jgi:PleD family two-component response regulator
MGYVVSESSLDDPLDLLAQADAAMYRSKHFGRPVRAC